MLKRLNLISPHCILGALLLGLSGCATLAAPEPTQSAQPVLNSDMDAPLMYRVLAGEIAFSSGVYDVAFAMMLKAAESAPDPVLYERAANIALQARSGGSALRAIEAWQKDFPQSIEAAQQKFGLELMLQKPEEATRTLSGLVRLLSPAEVIELGATLPRLLDRLKKPEDKRQVLLGAFEPLVNDEKVGASAHAILGASALQVGQTAQAAEHARFALAKESNNLLAITLGVALIDSGNWSLLPQVLRYLDAPNANLRVRFYVARALAQQSQNRQALTVLEVAAADPSLDSSSRLLLATLHFELKDWEQARINAQKTLEMVDATESPRPVELKDRNSALLLLAEIAQQQKDWSQAKRWLDQVDQASDPLTVLYRQVSVLADQGEFAKADSKLMDYASEVPQDERRVMWMRVQLYKDHDLWERAYLLLEEARAKFPDEADWVYTQGMVAEHLKRYDDMERLMRLHIQMEPDDHQARNALGYSLADRGIRLAEAKELIQQAYNIAPQDPFVADSWGWVLFKTGSKQQALKVLEQAWGSRADAEIAAHLGEVQWDLGQREAARATWAQGMTLDPNNKTLRQTIHRLDPAH